MRSRAARSAFAVAVASHFREFSTSLRFATLHRGHPGLPMNKLQACKVYISEGRNLELIKRLTDAASSLHGARLADVLTDASYNRSNFLLTSTQPHQLAAAATALGRAAIALLDLRQHDASHPRLGVVDHVSVQPVDSGATLAGAAEIANTIGSALGASVPVYMYSAAHKQQMRSLPDIRRSLGYFKGARQGRWSAELTHQEGAASPDYGRLPAPARTGVVAVGAVSWVTNLNVPLAGDGVTELEAARRVARGVSARSGGLPGVEAMALPHQQGTEIACNLLGDAADSPDAVTAEVLRLAALADLLQGAPAYVLGPTREQLLQLSVC